MWQAAIRGKEDSDSDSDTLCTPALFKHEQVSVADGGPEEDDDKVSVDSDATYYEEDDVEDYGIMCFSAEEATNRRFLQLQADTQGCLKEQMMLDFKKLSFLIALQNKLQGQSTDLNYGLITCFLHTIPGIRDELQHLAKPQIRTIIENIRIQVFERGTVLFNKDEYSS